MQRTIQIADFELPRGPVTGQRVPGSSPSASTIPFVKPLTPVQRLRRPVAASLTVRAHARTRSV